MADSTLTNDHYLNDQIVLFKKGVVIESNRPQLLIYIQFRRYPSGREKYSESRMRKRNRSSGQSTGDSVLLYRWWLHRLVIIRLLQSFIKAKRTVGVRVPSAVNRAELMRSLATLSISISWYLAPWKGANILLFLMRQLRNRVILAFQKLFGRLD